MKGARTALLAFVAIAIAVCALWFTSRSVTPKKATWQDVVAQAARGGYRIISTEQLWERYRKDSKDLLLVDTREEWAYRTGYLKGALGFCMEPTWFSRWRKKHALETLLGPDKNRLIVFY
jgi:hypothetical protein